MSLYVWLTGRLPYGEIEPYQTARFRRDPVPPSRLRPDVPIWLDHIVLKAVARDHKQRFETAEEMLLALEREWSLLLRQEKCFLRSKPSIDRNTTTSRFSRRFECTMRR